MPLTNKPYDKAIERFLTKNIKAKSRVIDVGCGTGWTALILARKNFGCYVDGIDINTLKIHRANRLFLQAKRDHLVHCHLCGAEELTKRFGASLFDYVVTNHSIHHFEKPIIAVKQMKAILKKKGKLLLTELTPEYGKKFDKCKRYSLSQIIKILKDAGLKIISAKIELPGVILIICQK